MPANLTRDEILKKAAALSPSLYEVFDCMVKGLDKWQTAEQLNLRTATVDAYHNKICKTIGLVDGTVKERIDIIRGIMQKPNGHAPGTNGTAAETLLYLWSNLRY